MSSTVPHKCPGALFYPISLFWKFIKAGINNCIHNYWVLIPVLEKPILLFKSWQPLLYPHCRSSGNNTEVTPWRCSIDMMRMWYLICLAKGQASSCVPCTTLTLWCKWLNMCHDNLEKTKSLFFLNWKNERIHGRVQQTTNIVIPTHHCTYLTVLQASKHGYICNYWVQVAGCVGSQGVAGLPLA